MPAYTQPEAYHSRRGPASVGDVDIEFEKELADLWGLDPWGDN